jgi:CheY-like chemotaxis protein
MALNISNLDLSGKNIIIVEDDLPSIRYYETLLKSSGADVMIFHTGKEFVDYLGTGNKTIDLVFMDFLIPLINGIECVRILRKDRKNTPVIMITAYLLKPIYPEKIFSLLEKYLKSRISIPHTY